MDEPPSIIPVIVTMIIVFAVILYVSINREKKVGEENTVYDKYYGRISEFKTRSGAKCVAITNSYGAGLSCDWDQNND